MPEPPTQPEGYARTAEAARFLAVPISEKYPFTLADAQPYESGVSLTFQGEKISCHLPGEFTIYNILAAATYALTQNIALADNQGFLAFQFFISRF